ncbi:hypothetical protein CRENBAI_013150, partial [Crenichthys baileyi]
RQVSQQLGEMTALMQHALSIRTAMPPGAAAEPPALQRLPHGRDVTSPCPEKFSGE